MRAGARRPVPQPVNASEGTADSFKSRPDSFKRMLGASRRDSGRPSLEPGGNPDNRCAEGKEKWSEKRKRDDKVEDMNERTGVPRGPKEQDSPGEGDHDPR